MNKEKCHSGFDNTLGSKRTRMSSPEGEVSKEEILEPIIIESEDEEVKK